MPYNLGMANFLYGIADKARKLLSKRTLLVERVREIYLKINNLSGGAIGILRHALNNLTRNRGAEASASLAYYALFSIFPILLVVVSAGSVFLEQELVKAKLLEAIMSFLPISALAVNDHIEAILKVRGAVTTFALISLVWSGSNVFEKIVININRAFLHGKNPGFFQSRVTALMMILALTVLFILSLAVNTLIGLLPGLQQAQAAGNSLLDSPAFTWVSWLLPLLLKILLFYTLYTWLPRHITVQRRARAIGALVAALMWELVTRLLTWAVGSGLANYQLVYGSLGSIIALLFWLYWTGYILFFGAHLAYAIDYSLQAKARTTAQIGETS
ncbi:MAG: YihY/virulence factor BrkB family protein [Anaerolineaceae bacterium]